MKNKISEIIKRSSERRITNAPYFVLLRYHNILYQLRLQQISQTYFKDDSSLLTFTPQTPCQETFVIYESIIYYITQFATFCRSYLRSSHRKSSC